MTFPPKIPLIIWIFNKWLSFFEIVIVQTFSIETFQFDSLSSWLNNSKNSPTVLVALCIPGVENMLKDVSICNCASVSNDQYVSNWVGIVLSISWKSLQNHSMLCNRFRISVFSKQKPVENWNQLRLFSKVMCKKKYAQRMCSLITNKRLLIKMKSDENETPSHKPSVTVANSNARIFVTTTAFQDYIDPTLSRVRARTHIQSCYGTCPNNVENSQKHRNMKKRTKTTAQKTT